MAQSGVAGEPRSREAAPREPFWEPDGARLDAGNASQRRRRINSSPGGKHGHARTPSRKLRIRRATQRIELRHLLMRLGRPAS